MVEYQVDGRKVALIVYTRSFQEGECRYINSIEDGQTMQGKMIFAKLVSSCSVWYPRSMFPAYAETTQSTTDDLEKVTTSLAEVKDLGSIVVEMWRGKQRHDLGQASVAVTQADVGTVHEKGKK